MGANLCSALNFKNKFDSNRVNSKESKEHLPPLFKRLDRIKSRKDSDLDHTKSWVDQSRQHFREELDCSLCTDTKVNRKEDETPMAWMRQLNDQTIGEEGEPEKSIKRAFPSTHKKGDNKVEEIDIKSNNVSKERLTGIECDVCAISGGIDPNLMIERSENDCENRPFVLRNQSMSPFGKHLNSSLESIYGSNDEINSIENNNSSDNCNQFTLQTEIHYSMSKTEYKESKDLIKRFSANLKLNTSEMSNTMGQKCSFCDFVANGCHQHWNELDSDVIKLMETVDKLSALLNQKELSLNKDSKSLVSNNNDNQNERKLKEKIIELRNKKRIGMSLHKIGAGKRLMVFKDGQNTYQIEISNPLETKSSNEEISVTNNLPETEEVIAQTYDTKVFRETKDNRKYKISTNKDISAKSDLRLESLPQSVDTLEVCDKAAARLRELANHLEHGSIPNSVLQKTLQYAAYVLDTVSMDETRKRPVPVPLSKKPGPIRAPSEPSSNALARIAIGPKPIEIDSAVAKTAPVVTNSSKEWTANRRRLLDEEDELSEVQPDAVPSEVREWLASTFTRSTTTQKRRPEDKPKFRSVAHAIRAGIMVDRIYRRLAGATALHIPSDIALLLKGADEWSFDVFKLNDTCKGQVLKYLSGDLLNRYGLIHKFKIPSSNLENFLLQIEQGYIKYSNPYHNNLHAADVTQTVHYTLWVTGLAQWLSDLEVFATLIAAIIHDFQHTGTTNNFHVMSGSDMTLVYNDRSVLENFHISAAFKVMRENDSNILINLSREEYREFRSLVIDMVLATDMSSHFQQIKTLKTLLGHTDFTVDKSKGLSYILHSSDISHPAKAFHLHYKWTKLLMEEFFRQGDMEKELGLPYSPLCDRNTTLIPQSQIGFIDFIVGPTMELCGDLIDRVIVHINGSQEVIDKKESDIHLDFKTRTKSSSGIRSTQRNNLSLDSGTDPSNIRSIASAPLATRSPVTIIKVNKMKRPWLQCLEDNKINWQERAAEDAIKNEQKNRGNGDSTPESEL